MVPLLRTIRVGRVYIEFGSVHGPSRGLLNPCNWKKIQQVNSNSVYLCSTLTHICHCQLSAAHQPPLQQQFHDHKQLRCSEQW
jgi:hypothetical protein